MATIKRKPNRIELFLQKEAGQRFFNVAYCVGAAIVIWGALFHILNLPGGKTLLCIGMGTEVVMFLLSAFDNPSRHHEADAAGASGERDEAAAPQAERQASTPANHASATSALTSGMIPEVPASTAGLTEQMDNVVKQMQDLSRNIAGLNTIYEIQLRSISGQLDNIQGVNQSMKDIRDMYDKSSAESIRYQEEAEKMTRHIQQLNAVYEKMLKALTVNMPAAGGAGNPYAGGHDKG